MKTEHKFALTLKTMMSEKALDDISVSALTKRCKVNRQTFYYYFHDIYDLLTLVFLDEDIEGIYDVKNFKEMVTCIYEYYEKNQKFIDATLESAGKDLFSEFVYNACYISTIRFIEKSSKDKNVSPNGKKELARFYASAFSNSIIYYIANYNQKSLKGLLKTFQFLNDDVLEVGLSNIIFNKYR